MDFIYLALFQAFNFGKFTAGGFLQIQPIKSGRRRALLLIISFLFCCQGNGTRNNRIMVETDEKFILVVFSYNVLPRCF